MFNGYILSPIGNGSWRLSKERNSDGLLDFIGQILFFAVRMFIHYLFIKNGAFLLWLGYCYFRQIVKSSFFIAKTAICMTVTAFSVILLLTLLLTPVQGIITMPNEIFGLLGLICFILLFIYPYKWFIKDDLPTFLKLFLNTGPIGFIISCIFFPYKICHTIAYIVNDIYEKWFKTNYKTKYPDTCSEVDTFSQKIG